MKEDDDDEFDDNNSISEHISVDSNMESDGVPQNVNLKKRHLFGMDTSDKDDDLLDDLLTGENIAKHFAVDDDDEVKIDKKPADESSPIRPSISEQREQLAESISKLKDLSEKKIQIKIHRDDDAVASTNVNIDLRERSAKVDLMKSLSQKEISPLQEDVILINNEKVSIDSLKNLIHDDHSFNTTNDVSDIGADDNSLSGLLSEGKQELSRDNILEGETSALGEPSKDPLKSDDSFEEDHSIEEVVVSNGSYNMDSNSKLDILDADATLDPLLIVNTGDLTDLNTKKIAGITQIVKQTIDELPAEIFEEKNDPDSLDSLSAEMDRILRDTIDDLPAEIFGDESADHQDNRIDSPNDPDSLENISEKVHDILTDTINRLPIGSESSTPTNFARDAVEDILTKTVNDLPIGDIDAIGAKIQEKITSIDPPKAKTHRQIVEEIEIEDFPPIVVKTMERCSYMKEMLDDITEESDISLEPKVHVMNTLTTPPATLNPIKEKGTELRKIIDTSYFNEMIFPVSPYLADFAQNEQQANSFDSVVSLNMLQVMENKVKELEEIVAGKDVCLAALNMQLDSRRNSIKDVLPSARDSYSLATVSTEYRTYQDEYINRVSSEPLTDINDYSLTSHCSLHYTFCRHSTSMWNWPNVTRSSKR